MSPHHIYRFGVFELRAPTGELRRAGVRVRLAHQTATLLLALLERPNELVSRCELQDRLWPETHVDRERGLNNAVNRLRHTLGDTGTRTRFIETVPKRGYRFIAPVEIVDGAPAPQSSRPRAARRDVAAATLIAAVLAAALTLWLIPPRTQGSAARSYYLAATQLEDRTDETSLMSARELFRKAVAADGAYAPALGALAVNTLQLGEQGLLPLRQARAEALSAAVRAVTLEPSLPEARLAIALVRIHEDWQWSEATRELQACLQHAPGWPPCLRAYATLRAAQGHTDDALAWIDRATKIDPSSAETHVSAGRLLLFARRYDEAIARLHIAIQLDPRSAGAHKLLSEALWHDGRIPDAQAAFMKWLAAVDVPEAELASVEAVVRQRGLLGLWRAQLERPAKAAPSHPGLAFKRATMYSALRDAPAALDALEDAAAERDARVMFLAVDPLFDPLAEEPRFRALLARVGLSQS